MKTDRLTYTNVETPCYIMEEELLRRNLSTIQYVAHQAGVEVILAFKSFALWKSFPIFREYINSTTASSLNEARLAAEEFGHKAHTYSPAYTEKEFPKLLACSSHLTFNSLSQYERFAHQVSAYNGLHPDCNVSCGLRINPEYSEIETEIYNPCAPGSRFGILAEALPPKLPELIEGFHCHCHCESNSYALQHTLEHIEQKFGQWFSQIKWLNLGGGHLITRKDYDVKHLITLLTDLRKRHPHLNIILEPGSAFAWQTGPLVATVVDVVENKNIKTAIFDASFTCHMPDCLEMPYQPTIRNAETLEPDYIKTASPDENVYRLGGNSCLSGDFMGCWRFKKPLKVGDRLIFEDMIHYTTVKTNLFNGIHHPSIAMLHVDGTLEQYREYGYEDYRDRMC